MSDFKYVILMHMIGRKTWFSRNLKNFSCEYDRLNGWNSLYNKYQVYTSLWWQYTYFVYHNDTVDSYVPGILSIFQYYDNNIPNINLTPILVRFYFFSGSIWVFQPMVDFLLNTPARKSDWVGMSPPTYTTLREALYLPLNAKIRYIYTRSPPAWAQFELLPTTWAKSDLKKTKLVS